MPKIYRTEIHALNNCILENLRRQFVRNLILMCTVRQGELKILYKHIFTFKLTSEHLKTPDSSSKLQQCKVKSLTKKEVDQLFTETEPVPAPPKKMWF